MNLTELYAIVAGGLLALSAVLKFCWRLWKTTRRCTLLVLRYLVYPLFIRQHRLVEPWSRSGFLLRVVYSMVNTFCSVFRISSAAEASSRVATLSLINLIPIFLGPHLSFLAMIMGFSLQTFKAVHGSSAVVAVLLAATHTILSVYGNKPFSVRDTSQLYGLIVSFLLHQTTRLTP